MKTDFSVLMSLYFKENPSSLDLALESVFNNSLTPSEVVLVKDGPLTNELEEVLQNYTDKYSILKIVKLETNQGLGVALTHGLKQCSYDLVARMDTDDICIQNRFEKQISFMLKHPEVDVLGGAIKEFDSDPNNLHSKRELPESDKDLKKFMKFRNPFNHMTVVFRKHKTSLVGGYKDFYFLEDYYLWLRMSLKDCVFHNLKDTLVYARTSVDMIKRRGGVKYFQSESRLLKFMLNNNILNIYEYVFSVISKSIVRLIGGKSRRIIYKVFLRK